MKRLLFCSLVFSSLSVNINAAGRGAEFVQSLRRMSFDPSQCYRVQELNFSRRDVKLFLTAGHLMFAPALSGRTLAAVFVADVEGGDAEVLVIPPSRAERQSLSQFTQSPTLDAHFAAALLLFTDDTGTLLRERVKEAAFPSAADRGALLADPWNHVLHNLSEGFQLRLAQDLLAGSPARQGFFFAALQTATSGNIEVLVDPHSSQDILVGQTSNRQNRTVFDIWTNFPSRTQREQTPSPKRDVMDNIRLETSLADNLHLRVKTRASLAPAPDSDGVLSFQLARQMRVLSARLDGQPAEVLQRDDQRLGLSRDSEEETFLVIPSQPPTAGQVHEIEIEQEGDVIQEQGRQVYFVNARTTWYPRQYADYSRYELTFRYPRRFDLVATGELVEERNEGDQRVSRYQTKVPVRQVGFNLGVYDKSVVVRGPYKVEVYANKHVEPALQPTPVLVLPQGRPSPTGRRGPPVNEPPVVPIMRPASLRDTLAGDVADSLTFMASRFGPLPLHTLTVSPVPAAFGQGFPGLVYLSTLAYLRPEDRPAGARGELQNLFYTDLLQAHEVAHQWWGNMVAPASPADDWIVESLANYSAMMYVEKKRGQGALDRLLASYRDNLVRKNAQDRSIESYGPIIWGPRLRQTSEPEAWRAITYEKGSWIIHMLRRRLGDEKFLAMLAALRQRFEGQPVSTAQFQALAQQFLGPKSPERTLDGFFEQWVYGTGIPNLKLQASSKGAPPRVRVSGSIHQTDVDDDFTALVPVEVQFSRGAPVIHWVSTSNEPAAFSVTVPAVPAKIVLDPGSSTLRR